MTPLAIGGRACNPALEELAQTPAWVCWRIVQRDGKPTKPPFTPAGSKASCTDSRTWSSFDECFVAAFVHGHHDGIGRVLTGKDGLVGIDLDNACALDGAVAPWANQIVESIPTYWERSPSGAGLHAWGRGQWPENRTTPFEVKRNRLYLTVTGVHVPATPDCICHCQSALDQLWHDRFDAAPTTKQHRPSDVTSFALPEPIPADLLASLKRTHPQLRRVLEGRYASASQRDLALCRFAKRARWEREAAWSLVRAVRTDGKAERPDYRARTLAAVGY